MTALFTGGHIIKICMSKRVQAVEILTSGWKSYQIYLELESCFLKHLGLKWKIYKFELHKNSNNFNKLNAIHICQSCINETDTKLHKFVHLKS